MDQMSDRIPMWRRYRRLFGANPRADVDDELEFHLQEKTDALVAMGYGQSDARREAERRLGDLRRVRQLLLDGHRSGRWRQTFGDLWRDVRLSLRRLLHEPGFSVMAVATLTLGVGAAVGVFAVVDTVVLRPLPYPNPGRLVLLTPGQNSNMALADALGEAPALQSSSGLSHWRLTLTGNGEPAELSAEAVDAAFFRTIGVQPALGRPFGPDERDPGRSDVVVLSYGLWQTRFGGQRDVVGRRIDLDGAGHATRQVIGVMPEGFVAPLAGGRDVSAWVPLSRAPGRTIVTDSTWYVNYVLARMTPNATVDQADHQVRLIVARLQREFPQRLEESRLESVGATGLLNSMVGDVRTSLLALMGAVGLVMLLVCANLANLLMARGERRRRELAVRAALGAGRGRLVREQVLDSTILALTGGLGGALLARTLLATLDVGRASALPRTAGLHFDWPVLVFALLVSLVAAAAFGLWPALRATAGDVRDDLGASARSPGMTRSGHRFGSVLVAGEIALATVLVTGAGLLLASLRELRSVDAGIDTSDVVAMQLAPAEARYEGEAALVLYDQLFERLRAIPGVRTVGAIHLMPFTADNWGFPYLAEGHQPPPGTLPTANFRVVTPGYFDAVDQPLLEGRLITDADRRGDRLRVGLINRTMAHMLWPDESAVGKTIRLFGSVPFEVVGVVGDVRQFTLDLAPEPEMYVPHGAGWSLASMAVVLEVAGDPGSIAGAAQRAVWSVDDDIPITSIRPMDDVLGESLARRRFFAAVLSFFGALALALGAVGVFGVMAYTMGARRGEFGIRMALGATRGRVLGGAIGMGVLPVGVGLVAGIASSLAASRLLESLLFGVTPGDPATTIAAGLTLAGIGVAATFVPAYRATSVDAAAVMRTP